MDEQFVPPPHPPRHSSVDTQFIPPPSPRPEIASWIPLPFLVKKYQINMINSPEVGISFVTDCDSYKRLKETHISDRTMMDLDFKILLYFV